MNVRNNAIISHTNRWAINFDYVRVKNNFKKRSRDVSRAMQEIKKKISELS